MKSEIFRHRILKRRREVFWPQSEALSSFWPFPFTQSLREWQLVNISIIHFALMKLLPIVCFENYIISIQKRGKITYIIGKVNELAFSFESNSI